MIRIARVQRLTICIEIERHREGGHRGHIIDLLS